MKFCDNVFCRAYKDVEEDVQTGMVGQFIFRRFEYTTDNGEKIHLCTGCHNAVQLSKWGRCVNADNYRDAKESD